MLLSLSRRVLASPALLRSSSSVLTSAPPTGKSDSVRNYASEGEASTEGKVITVREALREALMEEMERDEKVVNLFPHRFSHHFLSSE
tara:strand:- start:530 stop:793 length:264 start_codon:yes stop_codon:yes gene_type:complete